MYSINDLEGIKVNRFKLELIKSLRNDNISELNINEPAIYIVEEMLDDYQALKIYKKITINFAFERKNFIFGLLPNGSKVINCIAANRSNYSENVFKSENFSNVYLGNFNKYLRLLSGSINVIKYLFSIKFCNTSIKTIIFYNGSMLWIFPAIFAKFILKMKVILQFEDDYSVRKKFTGAKIGQSLLIRISDAFILNNPRASYKIQNKKFIVINGIGNINLINKKNFIKHEKLRFIYSGSIDDVRGAMYISEISLELEKIFGNSFEIFVTGFGPSESAFRKSISAFNNVKYYGFVTKDELTQLTMTCHCGLVLQPPDIEFSKGSYPSKIITYLSLGIPVIAFQASGNNCTWNIK